VTSAPLPKCIRQNRAERNANTKPAALIWVTDGAPAIFSFTQRHVRNCIVWGPVNSGERAAWHISTGSSALPTFSKRSSLNSACSDWVPRRTLAGRSSIQALIAKSN
jgi:hypothetical protein